MSTQHVAHWDDVRAERVEAGYLRADWSDLGRAVAGAGLGLQRIRLEPGCMPTPPHQHGAEEEIFYVLAGSGLSWQDGSIHEVRAGDCLVHLAGGPAHTLRAGEDGLEVLAFGMRVPAELCHLPTAGAGWLGPRWVDTSGPNPWQRAFTAGPPEFPAPTARPPCIVNADQVEPREDRRTTTGRRIRDLARAAGSVRTGLRLSHALPGMLNCPPHCHSMEEELFVVLGGDGTLLLGDEQIPLRPGHVVGRPPGTGVAHAFRGGPGGLELLMYGDRQPGDVVHYPRSGKVYFRGLRLIGRIEPLDYWDGEE